MTIEELADLIDKEEEKGEFEHASIMMEKLPEETRNK